MSSYSTWISIESIIQDYINKSAHTGNLNEELIFIAAEEAVNEVVTGDNFFEYVMLVNLYNQKAALPANFKYPTQVGYRPAIIKDTSCTPANDLKRYFLKTINNEFVENVTLDACVKCNQVKCCCETKEWYPIETTQSYVKLLKTPKLATGYSKFMYGVQNNASNNKTQVLSELSHTHLVGKNKQPYHEKDVNRASITIPTFFSKTDKCSEFQMVRPKSNYFFNLPGRLKACNVPNYDTNLEYDIRDGVIQLNNYDYCCKKCDNCLNTDTPKPCIYNYKIERDGQVLISYLGSKIDDRGFLMIPNELYIIKAITDYIISYMARIQYAIKMDKKTQNYFITMKQLSDVSMIQARSRFRMPSPDKWQHFIDNHWLKTLPYVESRENLNRLTPDRYDDTSDNTTNYPSNNYDQYYNTNNRVYR